MLDQLVNEPLVHFDQEFLGSPEILAKSYWGMVR